MRMLVAALLVASATGCAAQLGPARLSSGLPEGDSRFVSERAAIHALRARNNQAIAARDVDGTMSIAADDYVLVAGSDTIVRSAEAMRLRWAETFRDPGSRGCVRQPEKIEVGEYGDVLRAAEYGQWRCPRTTPAGEAEPHGSYFAHWSKRAGEWRVVSDNYVALGCRGSGC